MAVDNPVAELVDNSREASRAAASRRAANVSPAPLVGLLATQSSSGQPIAGFASLRGIGTAATAFQNFSAPTVAATSCTRRNIAPPYTGTTARRGRRVQD